MANVNDLYISLSIRGSNCPNSVIVVQVLCELSKSKPKPGRKKKF